MIPLSSRTKNPARDLKISVSVMILGFSFRGNLGEEPRSNPRRVARTVPHCDAARECESFAFAVRPLVGLLHQSNSLGGTPREVRGDWWIDAYMKQSLTSPIMLTSSSI
jgi:hypothetical protein